MAFAAVDFMDLSISKHDSFHLTGQVRTSTYRKPGCNPQYLAFSSQHKLSTRLGIYKSESTRYMVNCSDADDYHAKISDLDGALIRRGYPPCLLQRMPYRPDLRMDLLRKFLARGKQTKDETRYDIMVLKTCYSPQLRDIGVHSAYYKLLNELRTHLGVTFLRDSKFVVACPVSAESLFLATYGLNYPREDSKTIRVRSALA